MLSFKSGDLFSSETEALVNATNCVGIMSKGIALKFKQRYPEMFEDYRRACHEGFLTPGKLHTYKADRWIINFPTKDDWRNPSKYSWINAGLARLFAYTIPTLQIKSVAIPSLGCGNGGLSWDKVKNIIEKWYCVFDDVLDTIDVQIHEPLA